MTITHRRALAAVPVVSLLVWSVTATAAHGAELATGHPGPMSGIVHARGASHAGTKSPNLIYHGGPVASSGTVVKAIFWGQRWADPSFVGDKISGMDSFYGNVGGTSYMGTNSEYTDATGHVSTAVRYAGHAVDTTAAPSHAPQTSAILAEVARMIPDPVPNGYYPVYVDTPRGHTSYCAWHTYGTANGVVVQFGFFFNLDGDPGCDPQDTSSAHSQGLAALGNVSGHELSEMATDSHIDAWYDSSGAENADKCAWKFGARDLRLGNSVWKIQGNWSNRAYDAGAGYTSGGSVVRGCIDGTN